ncbi:amidophosphoribosyltransferase [Cladochytrium replicatum]|nr:amidophosphoribosyltransferase [Cladochytrium replicatum]
MDIDPIHLLKYVISVRYPTAGTSSDSEAQPFYVNSPYGLVFAHDCNGNLTNAGELRNFLDREAHRHVNTGSDSELLLNIFAHNLQRTGKCRVNEEDTFNALLGVYQQCRGGYAVAAMIAGFGVIGFRDPNGVRPLIYGERLTPNGTNYMIASESVVLEVLGYKNFVDIKPGEAIIVTRQTINKRQLVPTVEFTPCIFEYVNFARPDSIMDEISVYKARLAMGESLANQVIQKLGKEAENIDVVIPVPDTSRVAALQLSYKLNLLTFIMPGQSLRKKNVRRKLNPMAMEFAGKNVLIVDVYCASCSPPIRLLPNVYGIDMPTQTELVAFGRTEDQVAAEIGADYVIYESLEGLVDSVRKSNPSIHSFDLSVFNGCYVTGDITDEYLDVLEKERLSGKQVSPAQGTVIGLHNHVGHAK